MPLIRQPSLYANPGTMLFFVEPYNAWRRMKAQSEHTITRDTSTLLRFIRFCEERGINDPQAVTREFLERYQKYLSRLTTSKGQALSVRAQLSYILSFRGFFRFLSKERILPFNPAGDLDLPRVGKRLPSPLGFGIEPFWKSCTRPASAAWR
jgi:integrase/recombinase XerD